MAPVQQLGQPGSVGICDAAAQDLIAYNERGRLGRCCASVCSKAPAADQLVARHTSPVVFEQCLPHHQHKAFSRKPPALSAPLAPPKKMTMSLCCCRRVLYLRTS